MNLRPWVAVVGFCASGAIGNAQALPPEIQSALDEWRANHGQEWHVVFNEKTRRARMLLGGRASAPFVPRTEAQAFALARGHVDAAFALFGVESSTLVDDRFLILPLGMVGTTDKATVRFAQVVDGVPVVEGSVNVLFELATGALLSIDSKALPGLRGMDVTPTCSSVTALEEGKANLEREPDCRVGRTSAPRLVISRRVEEGRAAPRLAWEFELEGLREDGSEVLELYRTDARGGGGVLYRASSIHRAQQAGCVRAAATEDAGWEADDGSNRAKTVLAHASVELFPRTARAGSPPIVVTTDQNGEFHVPGGVDADRARARLRGPHVRVENQLLTPEDPSISTENLTATVPLSGPYTNVSMNPAPTGANVAEVNAFHRVNQMRDWVRSVNPFDDAMDSTELGEPYLVWVNSQEAIQSRCVGRFVNSSIQARRVQLYYTYFLLTDTDGDTLEVVCSPNPSYATFLWHEMGHWLNERYDNPNANPDLVPGFHEGCADVYALYQADFPIVLASHGSGRSGENPAAYCGDCDSEQGCHPSQHTNGLPLMGAFWKMRTELRAALDDPGLGGAVADALFLGFLNAYDTNRVHSIILYQLLVLDDDDGNLTNRTPNSAAIERGFRGNQFPPFALPPASRICSRP